MNSAWSALAWSTAILIWLVRLVVTLVVDIIRAFRQH